ncbi:hypothetical protein CEP54_014335 [Fusarium duplospermum]|uniref:Uncharacterized protein n=1 Tax=Fusarium duplospermum TaxID=1325734 RepID=A0A428NX21_9HYPO|nr:hypothetical protein CEP54_014335 [Fusarium duplospermum]
MSQGDTAGLRAYSTPSDGLWPISQAIFPPHVRSALRPTPASLSAFWWRFPPLLPFTGTWVPKVEPPSIVSPCLAY